MKEWLYNMFGDAQPGAEVAGVSFSVQGGFPVGWLVVLALAALAVTLYSYRWAPAEMSAVRRALLAGLRLAFFGLLLLLLAQPVVRFELKHQKRGLLAVMTDVSESMSLAEPRIDTNDIKRVAIVHGAMSASEGLGGSLPRSRMAEFGRVPRMELVKQAFLNTNLNLLPRLRGKFDVHAYAFGKGLQEVGDTNATGDDAWIRALKAQSPSTALGEGLSETLNKSQLRLRGNAAEANASGALAGIFVVTDGANNAGMDPEELIARLQRERVPLYIYGVGITSPRDIILAGMSAPDVVFKDDEITVQARVQTQGLQGEQSEVELWVREEGAPARKVDSKPITFGADGEQAVALHYAPEIAGDYQLEVRVPERADETEKENNAMSQRLRVVSQKINVLLVEQAPRWEYRYLTALLMRDKNIALRILLLEGDKTIARDDNANADSPFLKEMPDAEGLRAYDVVIFGDVDPNKLGRADVQEDLSRFVADFGGSLLVMAGKRFCPALYRGRELDQMLPVIIANTPAAPAGAEDYGQAAVRLQRTALGKESPELRMAVSEEENEKVWNELPPLYWVAKVERAKPSAQVLLVEAGDEKGARQDQRPVLAMHRFGAGLVMYMGTDNFWRWRKTAGDKHHTALWLQLIQRLALPRLTDFTRDYQLSVNRKLYSSGDRVRVSARLFGETGTQAGTLAIRYQPTGGEENRMELKLSPDDNRTYAGEFVASAPGQYRLFLEDHTNGVRHFAVRDHNLERTRTAMNEPLLRSLATKTGGAFFREEDLAQLPDRIPALMRTVTLRSERELWSSLPYFLLMLLVVTAEWIIRKLSYLK